MSLDADERGGRHRDDHPKPGRRPRDRGRRLRWSVAILATVAVGATAWAIQASTPESREAGTVLTVSHPQSAAPPGPAAGVASNRERSRSMAQPRDLRPTPARVGRVAPTQVLAERPREVTLASGAMMRVRVSATAATGELEIPADVNEAGWWDGGARLGDPYGAIVVAAHVDSFTQGLGSFAELLGVRPGDVLHLGSTHLEQKFRVVSAQLVPKASLSATSSAFSARGPSRLVLITCGGAYDPTRGGYQSNMIVVAEPEGSLVAHD